MNGEGFRELVGAELSGTAEGRAAVRERHLNPSEVVHGEAISTLVDISTAGATGTTVAEGDERPVAVEMKANYVTPGKPGAIVSEARVRKGGKRMTVVEAEVLQEEDGEVAALATGTYTIMGYDPGPHSPGPSWGKAPSCITS